MYLTSLILFTFFIATAYAAWFWRGSRPAVHWVLFSISVVALYVGFGWLVKRSGLSLTKATTLYDVVVLSTWLVPLIIWRERSVSFGQVLGISLVLLGSLLVAVSPDQIN
jgi:drug/metabolite transporter (DMT)-like permease